MLNLIIAVFAFSFVMSCSTNNNSIETKSPENVFVSELRESIHQNWKIPENLMSRQDLKTSVLVRLSGNGRLISEKILTSSGNSEFDASVEKAIKLAPFPSPPISLKSIIEKDGIELRFPN